MTNGLDLSVNLDLLGADGAPLLLDPHTIRPSRWANRHESAYLGAEFEELKAEIRDAGGNVQPIKVRPLQPPEGVVRHELVFGHRRHRACQALGLPVLAVVQDVDERRLWTEMERENRARANLSPWEQGAMYRRALEAGLFTSLRVLAVAIGRDPGNVSKAIALAHLPDEVVGAFATRSELQFRHAKALRDAVAANEEAVLAAARALAGQGRPADEVFQALVNAGVTLHSPKAAGNAEASGAAGVVPYNTPIFDYTRGCWAEQDAGPSDIDILQPSMLGSKESRAATSLCLVLQYRGALMEVATDASPREGCIPIRPLGLAGKAVQHVRPEDLQIVRVETR